MSGAPSTVSGGAVLKLIRLALLLLALPFGGCSAAALTTLSVTCDGSLTLSGAKSIDIVPNTANSGAVLSFPDPANEGRTGSIPVTAGRRCTIAPTSKI